LLAIAFCVTLMTFLKQTTWLAFGAWLAIGLVIYFAYARRRSLLH
jgi:APA family basic amino acid/polyamine antiporter